MGDKRIYYFNKENDVEELRQLIMNDDSDNESVESFGEDDQEESDGVSEREDDSESEQDASSDSEENDSSSAYFTGKDKTSIWKKKKPLASKRKACHNILLHLPGVIGRATGLREILDIWECFFDTRMLDMIVNYTNQYIQQVQPEYARERDAQLTDNIEIKAFIGLLYLAGLLRGNRLNLEELWDTNGNGVEKFRLTMSLRRFRFLMRCCRFDDMESRADRKKEDNLAPVRYIFEYFVENCRKYYSPGENLTIDEKLEAFRGRCKFRQYIPSKPAKYGIKIFAVVDAKLFYIYNLEIYAGKQPGGPYQQSNKPTDVVKRLATPLYKSGRNITCDNWFSDINLVKDLKNERLSYVGTLKKNKPQLPAEFVNTRARPEASSLFAFSEDCTILSYIPKKYKNVLLVSSLHNDDAIDISSGEKKKPELLTFYNETKCGVDIVDKMCGCYNVARNTKRWPMVVFFSMLNMAGINSRIIYIGNNQPPTARRKFLRLLSDQLTEGHLQRRSILTRGMPRELQRRLEKYRPPLESQENAEPGSKRKQCSVCTKTNKRRVTKYRCKNCNTYLCLQHTNYLCDNCVETIQNV